MAQEWTGKKAEYFVTMADVVIPDRRMQFEMVADLVPFSRDDECAFIDIGCGEGLLTKAILDRFPKAIAHASDVAEEMLAKAARLLGDYGSRVRLSRQNIHEPAYLGKIVQGPVGFITASLAIHHCDDGEKQTLFHSGFEKLTSPGAFILIDVVKPASEIGRRFDKQRWLQCLREQSVNLTGSEELFAKYEHIAVKFHDEPAEEDKPATLADNLRFLTEAGFQAVDCFWLKCGFAIFGGYKR
jgi:SAM-dependent methyltransferase